MLSVLRLVFWVLALMFIVGIVVLDLRPHFDRSLIIAKHKANSAQRDWSAFYGQSWVYHHSGMSYQDDISKIKELVHNNSLILSDLASSYYLASALPIFVVNLHLHQGRANQRKWKTFLDKRYFCYMEIPENFDIVTKFFLAQNQLKYVVVNRDLNNNNLRKDCFAFRGRFFSKRLVEFTKLIYQGEYLDLYEMDYNALRRLAVQD